jgi:hypothetical protein
MSLPGVRRPGSRALKARDFDCQTETGGKAPNSPLENGQAIVCVGRLFLAKKLVAAILEGGPAQG